MDCSICKEPIEVTSYGWAEGSNAEPINDGRCCDTCDMTKVLPARMEAIRTSSREELMERIKGRDSSDNLIIYKGTLYLAQNIDLE